MVENKFKGFFKDFEIDEHHAWNSDKKILIWISSGFSFLKDYNAYFYSKVKFEKTAVFIDGLSFIDKYLLWKEFKKERKKRAYKLFTKN